MKLKPCPHCGSNNIKAYLDTPSCDTKAWYHVVCLKCLSSSTTVNTWNKRINKEADRKLTTKWERARSALKVIHTWATFNEGSVFTRQDVIVACKKALQESA